MNKSSNNKERFIGDDFMFQLTRDELQNLISNNRISSWGGRRTMPYAFTEQNLYLLMTVLKGDLAVKQSRKLVHMFKMMKDYIEVRQPLLDSSIKILASQTEEKGQFQKYHLRLYTSGDTINVR